MFYSNSSSLIKQSLLPTEMVFPITLAVIILFVLILAFRKPFKSLLNKERKYILRNGRSEKATVVSLDYAGDGGRVIINNKPWMKIELEIHNGSNPYLVSLDAVLSYAQLNKVSVGKVIPVKIHPQDAMKAAIDWDNLQ